MGERVHAPGRRGHRKCDLPSLEHRASRPPDHDPGVDGNRGGCVLSQASSYQGDDRVTGRREIVFAAFVVLVLLGGVAFDLMGPEVGIPSAAETQGERFESRAVFCPPATGGQNASTYF